MESSTSKLQQQLSYLLEIIGVAHYMSLFLIGNVIFIPILFGMLFTPLFFIPIAYFTWMFYDRKTPRLQGRHWPFLRKLFLWKHVARFYPAKLHKTSDLDPSKNYMFCYHPHGVLTVSGFVNLCTEANNFSELFPGIKLYVLTLSLNFCFPVFREYAMGFGICDVSRDSIHYKLTKLGPGNSVAIIIGGAAEAQMADPDQPYRLKIKNRKGFIREALKAGSPLVPCFSFGESEVFYLYKAPEKSKFAFFQDYIHRVWGYVPVLFYGSHLFFPLRKEINTVVGAPLDVPQISSPTPEEIDYWHSKYIDALKNLFDTNKALYGRANKDLELF